MRDRILEVLKLNRNNGVTIEQIYKQIFHTEIEDKLYQNLCDEIKDLCNEKLVYCTNSRIGLYILNPFREGIFHIKRKKDCYVTLDDGTVFTINNNKLGAMDKDRVLIRITDYNSLIASVKEIILRASIVGEVVTIKNKRYVKANDNLYEADIKDSLVDGMLVLIKVDKVKVSRYYKASILSVIGHKNTPKIDEIRIIYEEGGMHGFSNETLEEVKNIESSVKKEDIEGRRDLQDEVIFTIDGVDTKDIDDAVSLKILPNGNYLLGVHIADVTNYVKEGTSLDNDARLKGTSIYMPGVVEPMYPVELSNGICSLNEGVTRLAMSVLMEIDDEGSVINYDIFKSVIKSKKKMNYDSVNRLLNDDIVDDGYQEFYDVLKNMEKLAKILRNMRIKRGLLDFDSSEIKINVDDGGKVLNIEKRHQGVGENLIEDFMLMANEVVATYIYNLELPSIYRVHDYPNEERLIKVCNVIKTYGEDFDSKISIRDPKVIQKLLKQLKPCKNFDIYSNMILRCMAKACYKTVNEGHFGIGIDYHKNEAYTHFTSPIRRYPDTSVHRVLKDILDGNCKDMTSDSYKNNLLDIANHSSQMEKVADNCEISADKMKMASYIKPFVGKSFNGRITGFTYNAMFVVLENLVEGRLDFKEMDDYYNYNEDLEVVVGERKKKVFRLGDSIKVKVIKADEKEKIIDFAEDKGGKNHGNFKQKGKVFLFRRRGN